MLLLHTKDRTDGCTLLVTLDHLLGDALSLMMFMKTWSNTYQKMTGVSLKGDSEMALPATFSCPSPYGRVMPSGSGFGSDLWLVGPPPPSMTREVYLPDPLEKLFSGEEGSRNLVDPLWSPCVDPEQGAIQLLCLGP